jgi:hypothetical protein
MELLSLAPSIWVKETPRRRDAACPGAAYRGRERKEEGVVGRSLFGGVVVAAAVALAFVAVALTLALNH